MSRFSVIVRFTGALLANVTRPAHAGTVATVAIPRGCA